MPVHIVILGAGPAGYVAALRASDLGANVTLIDSSGIGGTCLHRGCIPTKTLVSTASLLDRIKSASRLGVNAQPASANWPDVSANVDRVVTTMTDGVVSLLKSRNVTIVSGVAKLLQDNSVWVEGHGLVNGDFLLIATGSRPARPSSFPFDGERVVTSDELLKWKDLPDSLAIVGEGIIACEFAFIFSSLGVKITIVGLEDKPAPTLDTDISMLIGREMRKRGIQFNGGMSVKQIEVGEEQVSVLRQDGSAISAARALVCVGRVPNTDGLNLSVTEIKTGSRGEILVDSFMRTNLPNVYAAGDVTGKIMLANAASSQGKIAVEQMLGHSPASIDDTPIPLAVFTSPEVGSVGLTEQAARKQGIEVRCGTFENRGLGKAQAMGELAGLTKIVADAKTGKTLGVHVFGPHATDIIHEAVIAIQRGFTVKDIAHVMHGHPTLSEGIVEAAEDVFGQAIHKAAMGAK